nr:Rrf2 family transcriptional regulator [uncultured Cohaesibacter sp.]
MPTDSRLPRVLHTLLHLDEAEAPLTSEMIGKMLGTNPSLVRRTMAGLRKAGMVESIKGHGGGWILAKSLDQITLAEVYDALGTPTLFAVGVSGDRPDCLLERAANVATVNALDKARESFLSELKAVTVADLFDEPRTQVAAFQRKTGSVCGTKPEKQQ